MPSPDACVIVENLEGEMASLPASEVLSYVACQVADELDTSSLVFVVRSSPPALAALGEMDEVNLDLLKRWSAQLQSRLRHFRYVNYQQAQRDCEALAEQLSQRVGLDVLSEAQFIGIPRGGLIVLGMLSYVLDLDHAQIGNSISQGDLLQDDPVIVIDDCAITGSRIRRFLNTGTDREVIFGTLYSHPNLRSAVEEESPHVTTFVSGRDLHDRGPDELGDEYSTWQARWHERHPDRRYWIGHTEHLCFPWGEIDTVQWDPESEEIESGFRFVPPRHCLQNRHGTNHSGSSDAVQIQPDPQGPIRPSPAIFFGAIDEQVIVADPSTEACVELDGTAAVMWNALIEHGTIDDTLEALLPAYSIDEKTLRTDLVGFVKQLATHGLLHVPDGLLT